MATANVSCPNCKNQTFDKYNYTMYRVKDGMVMGWKLQCKKCQKPYILEEHIYQEIKDKFANKTLHNIDEVALKIEHSLLEEIEEQ